MNQGGGTLSSDIPLVSSIDHRAKWRKGKSSTTKRV